MIIPYLMGWVLIGCAFVAASAEATVRIKTGSADIFVTTMELWRTMGADTLFVFRHEIARLIHPMAWDPVAKTLFLLPAWSIMGIPGMVLVATTRPHRPGDLDIDEDAIFLFDELAKRAREEGYIDGDDQAPDHEERPIPTIDELMEFIPPDDEERRPGHDDRPVPTDEELEEFAPREGDPLAPDREEPEPATEEDWRDLEAENESPNPRTVH